MPKSKNINKVLLIGSGPIQIGQAAEFDFSGSQACRALREEGVQVVLVNSNPATIMTDFEMADVIYIEPLVTDVVAVIGHREFDLSNAFFQFFYKRLPALFAEPSWKFP